ncbi:hypothetical protein FB550_10114 [Neobacillus bataviensis]|uniref:Uncharacterized protein n=1 Tax=Neobacillus bataviensis TaxID=220685 RepID=A0A561DXB9_9BACI|nr:hypothetical protein [Neobacillus bataviensis]TWE08003.1 hypothetical protein FB550_10114 [Neobacillus bataviensis]
MDTPFLFYKIHQGDVDPIDYINWALKMLENNNDSFSLNIHSSLSEPLNIFEVEDYFKRALSELKLQEPAFEECAEYYIQQLAKRIFKEEDSAIDLAYKIDEIVRELDISEGLEGWYNISEMIDDFFDMEIIFQT